MALREGPTWEPMRSPLDELREIARSAPEADWEAWEREIDSPMLRAALDYMRGE